MPNVLLPVIQHKQIGEFNCLPACACMVLRYLGQKADEAGLAKRLGTTERGTPGNRLLRLSSSTLEINWGSLTLPLIRYQLDSGAPVIALVRTIFLDYWEDDMAHAVVVVGYQNDDLWLNDPALVNAPQRASKDGFLAAWGEYDYLCATFLKR
jgi:ABC-type bacteriocin/lantibiotic exporter with double-glycine peptidase domain